MWHFGFVTETEKKKTTSAMVRGQLQQSNSQKVCRGTFEMSGSSATSVTVIVKAWDFLDIK